jgi:hypothetical protein
MQAIASMRTRAGTWLASAMTLAGLSSATACSPDVADPVQGLAVVIKGPLGAESPFSDPNAAFMALVAEGPGIPTDPAAAPAVVQPLNKGGMTLAMPTVPYGFARQIRVEIYPADANGLPTFPVLGRGRTAPMDVNQGQTFLTSAFVTRTNNWATPLSDEGAETATDARVGVAAVRLADSTVLLAGGGSFKAGASNPFDPNSYDKLSNTVLRYDVGTRKLGNLSIPPISATLTTPRTQMATATGPDGQVVLVGGYVMGDLGPVASNLVEYWDPKDAKIKQATSGSPHLFYPRAHHSVTRLFDNQTYYLAAGGKGTKAEASATWEIWDPLHGVTAQGLLAKPRWNHAAVRLPERDGGYVMLIGGENDNGPIADFEVLRYDNVGNISYLGNKKVTCYCGATTYNGADSNDKCAALAGQAGCNQFTWEPLLRTFEPAIGRTMPGAVFVTTETTAQIWIVGGFADAAHTQPLSRVDVFDLATGQWLPAVPALEAPRGAPMVDATLAGSERGRVVVVGGLDSAGKTVDKAEVLTYEAGSGVKREWADGTVPGGGRVLGAAVALRTGHVLVVGGATGDGSTYSAVTKIGLYNPR